MKISLAYPDSFVGLLLKLAVVRSEKSMCVLYVVCVNVWLQLYLPCGAQPSLLAKVDKCFNTCGPATVTVRPWSCHAANPSALLQSMQKHYRRAWGMLNFGRISDGASSSSAVASSSRSCTVTENNRVEALQKVKSLLILQAPH